MGRRLSENGRPTIPGQGRSRASTPRDACLGFQYRYSERWASPHQRWDLRPCRNSKESRYPWRRDTSAEGREKGENVWLGVVRVTRISGWNTVEGVRLDHELDVLRRGAFERWLAARGGRVCVHAVVVGRSTVRPYRGRIVPTQRPVDFACNGAALALEEERTRTWSGASFRLGRENGLRKIGACCVFETIVMEMK